MDSVSLAMQNTAGGKGHPDKLGVVIVTESDEGVQTASTAIPPEEWTEARRWAVEHYRLNQSTRVDCINIITALSLALTDK